MRVTPHESLHRRSASFDGIATAWLDEGQGQAIVALHGIPTSSSLFEPLLPHLDGFRLIAPDLLGQGFTEVPAVGPLDHAAYARHLEAFLREVPPASFHLMVHDLGGVLGLEWAADNSERVRSLVILSTTVTWTFRVGVLIYGSNLLLGSRLLTRVLPAMLKSGERLDDSLKELWAAPWTRRRLLRGRDHFARRHLRRLRSKLGDIRSPSLLIWGEKDDVFPLDHAGAIRRRLPQARLVALPRCGHWSPLDATEEVGTLASEFFTTARP